MPLRVATPAAHPAVVRQPGVGVQQLAPPGGVEVGPGAEGDRPDLRSGLDVAEALGATAPWRGVSDALAQAAE